MRPLLVLRPPPHTHTLLQAVHAGAVLLRLLPISGQPPKVPGPLHLAHLILKTASIQLALAMPPTPHSSAGSRPPAPAPDLAMHSSLGSLRLRIEAAEQAAETKAARGGGGGGGGGATGDQVAAAWASLAQVPKAWKLLRGAT